MISALTWPLFTLAKVDVELYDKVEEEEEYHLNNRTRRLTEMFVLFFGLFFHNTFVGVSLGVAGNNYQLFIAVIFHQFAEGLGMGSRVAMANIKSRLTICLIDLLFSLSAPAGIAVGLAIKGSIENGSFAYNIVEGVVQALSGGILIYISGTHMMTPEIDESWSVKVQYWHRFAAYVGILVGSAAMAVMAIWA